MNKHDTLQIVFSLTKIILMFGLCLRKPSKRYERRNTPAGEKSKFPLFDPSNIASSKM